METLKFIGSSFGYILSAIALLTMVINFIRRQLGGFVKKETKTDDLITRIERLEKTVEKYTAENNASMEQLMERTKHQEHASKQVLAYIIEYTYNRKKAEKSLTPIELERITNAYPVYHTELHGNSYISQIYDEMINEWTHE